MSRTKTFDGWQLPGENRNMSLSTTSYKSQSDGVTSCYLTLDNPGNSIRVRLLRIMTSEDSPEPKRIGFRINTVCLLLRKHLFYSFLMFYLLFLIYCYLLSRSFVVRVKNSKTKQFSVYTQHVQFKNNCSSLFSVVWFLCFMLYQLLRVI